MDNSMIENNTSGEIYSGAIATSASNVVSNRLNLAPESARKNVARIIAAKAFLAAATFALLASSGCGNTGEVAQTSTVGPSLVPTPISTEVASDAGGPEKLLGLIFDGKHILEIPHSPELDGKKGMEINIAFRPSIPEIPQGAVEGTRIDGAHLVIGGNDGKGWIKL